MKMRGMVPDAQPKAELKVRSRGEEALSDCIAVDALKTAIKEGDDDQSLCERGEASKIELDEGCWNNHTLQMTILGGGGGSTENYSAVPECCHVSAEETSVELTAELGDSDNQPLHNTVKDEMRSASNSTKSTLNDSGDGSSTTMKRRRQNTLDDDEIDQTIRQRRRTMLIMFSMVPFVFAIIAFAVAMTSATSSSNDNSEGRTSIDASVAEQIQSDALTNSTNGMLSHEQHSLPVTTEPSRPVATSEPTLAPEWYLPLTGVPTRSSETKLSPIGSVLFGQSVVHSPDSRTGSTASQPHIDCVHSGRSCPKGRSTTSAVCCSGVCEENLDTGKRTCMAI